jgi:hypothetical protein
LNTEDTPQEDIDKKATFALTWEGLKVKSNTGATLRIGDNSRNADGDNTMLAVYDEGERTFTVKADGTIEATRGKIGSVTIGEVEK